MAKIIPNQIIKEIIPNFLVTLLVLTFILVLTKVMELTELVVIKGVKPLTILKFLAYSLPFFLSITIPMSTLLAVLLTFLRMSADNEIIILKSMGISLYKLLPPVMLFCLWAYLMTSYMFLHLVPVSNRAFRNELLALAKKSADISIKERIFNNNFKELVLYVNRLDFKDGWMNQIFIQDARDPNMKNVITASKGRLTVDSVNRTLVLELFDGIIDRMEESITFERYDLKLDFGNNISTKKLAPPDQFEMSLEELFTAIKSIERDDKHYYEYRLEAHKRFSLPFASLIFGLLAVPLGVKGRGRGKNWGVSMGLGVVLVYYIMFSAGLSFGENGAYPPALGMWMPNIVLTIAGIYILYKTNLEAPLGLEALLKKIRSFFSEVNGKVAA